MDDISNGDVGFVKSVYIGEDNDSTITVSFGDGRCHEYGTDELEMLELAYAMTIHKSQGSEYDTVIIPMMSSHYIMLRRNLIYTAITRAKKKVIIVGQKKALYLSTMFNISDITIDKEEVALSLNIRINIPEETSENTIEMIEELLDSACRNCENTITDDQISVPETIGCVPESHLRKIVRKTAKVLFLQGLTCASCTHARYILSHLSTISDLSDDCKRKSISTEYLTQHPHKCQCVSVL